MSAVSDLVDRYGEQLRLPWKRSLSGAERVWMLVYPPTDERRVRARLTQLRNLTLTAGHGWLQIDLTDDVGAWIAGHEYAEAFYSDPTDLTPTLLEDLESALAAKIRTAVTAGATDEDTVVTLVGVGALFPFIRVSRVIQAVEDAVPGRLLVLFPGHLDRATHSYRLLDARDGFNYRAHAITADKDLP